MTTSKVSNIKLFLRMDAEFIRNIIPHVNISVVAEGHYTFACFSPKAAKLPVVKAWMDAQDQTAIAEGYLNDDTMKFSDERISDKNLKYVVVGMSLSQLDYCQLAALADEHCHAVIKLPSDRLMSLLTPTKNPLLFIDLAKPQYLYFARNRAIDQMINLTR